MKIKFASALLLAGGLAVRSVAAGEILGHISDETEALKPGAEKPNTDDRRIIYRVICTPGGEILPDCERSVGDVESEPNEPQQQTAPTSAKGK